jgi:Domain of unknown function (DUF4160)
MPTIFIEGYKFRFYSSDYKEPPHVHIFRGDCEAKIWLTSFEVQYNHGYNTSEINALVKLTQTYHTELLEKWNAHFNK